MEPGATPFAPWDIMCTTGFLKQQARYRYRRALAQVRKGNLGVALETLPNALDHHPYPADIHVTLGKTSLAGRSTGCSLRPL